MDRRRIVALKAVVFAGGVLPGVLLAWHLLDGSLRANPYQAVVNATGLWSWRLLLLGLAISPLRAVSGWNLLIRLRRMLGLFAAFYAALHLAAWAKDYGFHWSFLGQEILLRRYLTVGFLAALLLVPLTLTSTRAAARRLGGRAWQRLHYLVYPAALAAFLHYAMARRLDWIELYVDGMALAVLLLWRLRQALYSARRSCG